MPPAAHSDQNGGGLALGEAGAQVRPGAGLLLSCSPPGADLERLPAEQVIMFNCATTMRYAFLLLIAGLCALVVACKSIDPIRLEPTIEDPPALSSAIRFSNPGKASQLLRGFYDLQAGSWRWTAPHFAVTLVSAPRSATRGARLVLEFDLPDSSIAALKNVTVAANIGNVPLPPETYSTPGPHQYQIGRAHV